MKKLLLVLLMASFVSTGYSQNRKPEWVTLTTPNVRCWECKQRLESYMAREISNTQSGIIKMQINLVGGTTRVQYWPDRVNVNYIQTSVNNAGFDADTTKATEEVYKTLPLACKRNEEGGGPKKGKPCHMQPYKK